MKMRRLMCIFVSSLFWSFVLSNTCTTPLGATSNCISLYDCPQLLVTFEQMPLPLSVVSFLKQSQCGFEGNSPKVCCGPLSAQSNSSNMSSTTKSPRTGQNETNSGQVEPVSEEDSRPAPPNSCGVDTNGDKIYGGQLTELDEFPWMALLGYRTPTNSITYKCGGALINHRYVLTAAHCLTGDIERAIGKLVTVRLGEYDIQKEVDCRDGVCADPPQEIPLHVAYPHPGYTGEKKNRQDDIGLVRLARRAIYSYYVRPVCLVSSNERLDVGMEIVVAGWGKTLDGKNSPVKLKQSMPIFSKDECVRKFQTLGAVLTDKQVCAGGVFAQGTCQGDSGGPLMRKRPEGVWETVAIVSFGYGCGRDGWPGVYTSVASYIDWIQSTMKSSNV